AIERVRSVHPLPDGRRQKVDLISHSLGGLLARYYVKYGSHDGLDGGRHEPGDDGAQDGDTVRLIGVPHEGAGCRPGALDTGVRIVGPLPPEAIFTMPAAYQGLPRLRVGPFIDPTGQRLDIDLYQPENWEKYGWSAFSPARLRRLREESFREFSQEEAE